MLESIGDWVSGSFAAILGPNKEEEEREAAEAKAAEEAAEAAAAEVAAAAVKAAEEAAEKEAAEAKAAEEAAAEAAKKERKPSLLKKISFKFSSPKKAEAAAEPVVEAPAAEVASPKLEALASVPPEAIPDAPAAKA